MWGLEYELLFGLPNNKLELLDGYTPTAFPFLERSLADAHVREWTETIRRWKGTPSIPSAHDAGEYTETNVAGFLIRQFRRPIQVRVPIRGKAYFPLYDCFWERELWDGQPDGRERGHESIQRHADVKFNLWKLFHDLEDRHRITHGGGVDVMLNESTIVAPDQVFYSKPTGDWMVAGDYFAGPPDLIAEVLSPATRTIDRGPRMDLYARAGVPHVWLLDPEVEAVEVYSLNGRAYRLEQDLRPGDETRIPATSHRVKLAELFNTQEKRRPHPLHEAPRPAEPLPAWRLPPDTRLGLEYLFLFGHPERRHEIWDNRAPCLLAFGSEDEAVLRFTHFLEEMCRWEDAGVPTATSPEPGIQAATAGKFHLRRDRHRVRLDVTVHGGKYRELLETWSRRDAWDWGEAPTLA